MKPKVKQTNKKMEQNEWIPVMTDEYYSFLALPMIERRIVSESEKKMRKK